MAALTKIVITRSHLDGLTNGLVYYYKRYQRGYDYRLNLIFAYERHINACKFADVSDVYNKPVRLKIG